MFHERQRWALCGVHAINNLLQEHRYDKSDFDAVCQQLAPESWIINPHRSFLGIGNYDVNVLMVLLEQQLGYQVKWKDSRKAVDRKELMEYYGNGRSTSFGILVNLPSASLVARYITKGRHWLTLLWQQDTETWINLDSNLDEPQVIGNMDECANLLNEWRSKQQCHLILVRKDDDVR